MKLTDQIFLFLSNHPGNYRNLRLHMMGDPRIEEEMEKVSTQRRAKYAQEKVLKSTLYRLKENGLLKENGQNWSLTIEGLRKFKSQKLYKNHTTPIKGNKTDKKVIIAFDIPEDKKRSRYWLRVELVGLGFKLLQKSVWLGPAPLPKEFIEHLKTMDLLPHLKFFEVKEKEIV